MHQFIPSYILEQAVLRSPEIRHTFQEDQKSRTLRTTISLEDIVSTADAEIQIWDAQNEWVTRVHLADANLPAYKQINTLVSFSIDWFKRVLGRKGIDKRGSPINVVLNYGKNYPNAFWNGRELVFGNGDGIIFQDFYKSIDVVAHELSHSVVQDVGGLTYQGQSGALNEHFADVFGTAIQQAYENADKPDWLIGDEIMGKANYGEALRSISHPGCAYNNHSFGKDQQPEHTKDLYTGNKDNGGVHINSGIVNKMFYLAAIELGTQNAARLWYSCLLNLWPDIQFSDMVEILTHQARKLGHSETLPRNAAQVIRAAAKEVGL